MNLAFASKRGLLFRAVLVGMALLCLTSSALAASGNFLAVINEQNGNGDARRSVTFFDAETPGTGALFTVFIPYEQNANFEEPDAITVNPTTGDIYIIAFDSTPNSALAGDPQGYFDYGGDHDLYRINFADVYDDWTTNYEGTDVRSPLDVGGPAPNQTVGGSATNLADYVTYGVPSPTPVFPNSAGPVFHTTHSNTVVLPGAIEKVGEVVRNPNYAGTERINQDTFQVLAHEPELEFIDENTLIYLDEALNDGNNTVNDYDYRLVERVDTVPDQATEAAIGGDGGYNEGTTESWESRRIGKVLLDAFDENGDPIDDISNPQSIAFYSDPLSGVRGVWVGERDGGGDDIAFFEIDSDGDGLGYREQQVGAGPEYPTAFALDDNPFSNPSTNDGTVEKLFVDQDTGDLIIVEGSYADDPTTESGVIRREIAAYDNGSGRIQFGAWDDKVVLGQAGTLSKDLPGDTFLERGYWTTWDSVNDRLFFISPGESNTDPLKAFAADIYVLNMNEDCDGSIGGCDEGIYGEYGETMSFMNVDESISLFFGTFNPNYGDKFAYFSLNAEEPILIGDYNGDGKVSAGDFTVWADNVGAPTLLNRDPDNVGPVGNDDFESWKDHYGEGTFGSGAGGVAGSASVPEPASFVLVLCGMMFLAAGARRRACRRIS